MLLLCEKYFGEILRAYPKIRLSVKKIYQYIFFLISYEKKYIGDFQRVSPMGGDCFFGYYDKSPWDITNRYLLCIRVKNAYSRVSDSNMPADILLIDTEKSNQFKIVAKSNTWNVQQGCMLQWLGPEYKTNIIYNDFIDNRYCSIILDIKTEKKKILKFPVYAVANNGAFALSLDFSRLHRLRPGYGYSNIIDATQKDLCPDSPCIYKIDLLSGEVIPILRYVDLFNFEHRTEMDKAEHKVNHIMINPAGNRFMMLHRWIDHKKKYTRLITADINGKNLYNLNDDDMTSHCCWKNDYQIIAYANKHGQGRGYYIFTDKSSKCQRLWKNKLEMDGHPSYSPKGDYIITDSYPNRKRMSSIYLIKEGDITEIVRTFNPFKYDNDTRCDLHPRFSRNGEMICFDAVFEGVRQLYLCKLNVGDD